MDQYPYETKMLLIRYFSKLFIIRLVLLMIGIIIISFIFEMVMVSKQFNISFALLKIPFVLHKSFPFLVFIATLLFLWRLMRFHEFEALYSSGVSLVYILFMPLFIVGIFCLSDLFILAPISQRLINPFKEGRVSFEKEGWEVRPTHNKGYQILLLNKPRKHILTFSADSSFKHHLITNHLTSDGFYKNAWDITPFSPPQKRIKGQVILRAPVLNRTNQHPSFMSFLEVNKALTHNKLQKKILLFRRDYLLSHLLWILTLLPLGAAVMVGFFSKYTRILFIIMGISLCFIFYLCQEWLYFLSLTLSYIWTPLILWIIPFASLLVSFIILFEKKEL